MALVNCGECGKQVSTEATACPHCGAPVKAAPQSSTTKSKKTHPILKFFGILIIVGFAVSIIGQINKAETEQPRSMSAQDLPQAVDAAPAVAVAPPPTSPSISISAFKLFSDYNANEVAADIKYKGKRLEISGSVASINKDFTDDIWVGISTPNDFLPVHASGFSADQVVRLNKGDRIKLICIGAGMVVGSPVLKDCS